MRPDGEDAMTSTRGKSPAIPGRQRERWADHLRVLVISAVVVWHTCTAYLAGSDWYYMERTTSTFWAAVAFPASIIAIFALGPLYLVAGWFSARSLAHHGTGAFARTRLLRLGAPLIVFIVLIDPLARYLGDLGQGRSPILARSVTAAEAGPMWFVAALLAFSLGYALLRRLRAAPAAHRPMGAPVIATAALMIAVTAFLAWQWWPLDDAKTFLNLRWGLWPQGAVLFAVGVRAGEAGGLEDLAPWAPRLGWTTLGAVALFVAFGAYGQARGLLDATVHGTSWPTIILAVLYGMISVTFTIWFTDFARTRWSANRSILARAGRASYAAYFLHPLLLTAIMVLFASVVLAPELKFLIVSIVAIPVCFMIGYAVTQLPVLSKVL
jgi:acyltransferase-like protein